MSKKQQQMEDIFITREDLRDYIHDIHNFLRNNGCGYGQTGLKIFNVFYGIKLIKPYLKSLNLTPNQEKYLDWDILVKKSKETGEIIKYIDEQVLEELFNLKNKKDDKNHNLGKFLFYQIPRDLKDNIWKELIRKIDILPVGFQKDRKVNLSGKVYEYFCSQDATAISEMGAYFTDRHITDFIFCDLLKIQVKNNENIPTLIDPFGGSGGFTLGFANYLQNNFEDINWEKNVNNIFHFDMEETVINMTGLEMFAITGNFPNTKNNYIRGNSFTTEFNDLKCDLVVSNAPYGGDKITKTAEQLKRDKLISYIKEQTEQTDILKEQLKELTKKTNDFKKQVEKQTVNLNNCSSRIKQIAREYNIDTAKDKEACSLLLFMDLLTEKGTCVAVMKEGVFFDNKYSLLRGTLIENYNITDIISVPQSAFENTSTKTSIIKFTAGSKTKKIKFSELVVDFETEDILEIKEDGKVHLTKNKGEIKSVKQQTICHATYKQLTEPTITKSKKGEEVEKYNYSLNYKDYKDNKVFCPEGYELKKLENFFKMINKTKRLASFANETGKYRYYSSGGQILKCDEADITKQLCIIIGHSGNGCIFIDDEFSTLLTNHILYSKTNDELITYYTYNYIKYNWMHFYEKCYNGSTVQNTNDNEILNYLIPIPKDIKTIQKELTKLQKLHQQIAQDTELIPEKEKNICNLIKKLTDEGKEGVDYESKKLGDVCEINPSSKQIKDRYIKYLDITGCNSFETKKLVNNNNLPSRAKKTVIHNDVIISSVRPANKNINIVSKRINIKNLLISTGFIIMRPLNINPNYIYQFLKSDNITNYLIEKSTGSGYPAFSSSILNELNIKILKPSIMSKHKLQQLFDEVDELKDTLEENKKTYQVELNKLFKDFKEQDDENSETEEQETKEQETEEHQILTYKKVDYYLIGEDVYTIKDEKPDKIFGTYKNNKFTKLDDMKDKIIVKKKEKTVEELEVEL